MHAWPGERGVCSAHWSVVTLRGQVASEAYEEDSLGGGGPSAIPGDFWLSRSVCWHSPTSLTFSLTPYQNVFLSHTPLTSVPLLSPSHRILDQLFHLVVRSDMRTFWHRLVLSSGCFSIFLLSSPTISIDSLTVTAWFLCCWAHEDPCFWIHKTYTDTRNQIREQILFAAKKFNLGQSNWWLLTYLITCNL